MGSQTLFEKYGGLSTISDLIVDFYHRVLKEPQLKPYFKDIDMNVLMEHQIKLFTSIFNGEEGWSGLELKTSHDLLNISDEDFNVLGECLVASLKEKLVKEEDIEIIMAYVEKQRVNIIKKTQLKNQSYIPAFPDDLILFIKSHYNESNLPIFCLINPQDFRIVLCSSALIQKIGDLSGIHFYQLFHYSVKPEKDFTLHLTCLDGEKKEVSCTLRKFNGSQASFLVLFFKF